VRPGLIETNPYQEGIQGFTNLSSISLTSGKVGRLPKPKNPRINKKSYKRNFRYPRKKSLDSKSWSMIMMGRIHHLRLFESARP
jgi:hypothetical protein